MATLNSYNYILSIDGNAEADSIDSLPQERIVGGIDVGNRANGQDSLLTICGWSNADNSTETIP